MFSQSLQFYGELSAKMGEVQGTRAIYEEHKTQTSGVAKDFQEKVKMLRIRYYTGKERKELFQAGKIT